MLVTKKYGGTSEIHVCQVYKLFFGYKIGTYSVSGLQETHPIPAVFYFINPAIFYRISYILVYCVSCHLIKCCIRLAAYSPNRR